MATQTKLIRGKIARILSTREVALNIGDQNGVALGMLFDIVSEAGLDIRDPDTDRELGSVELPKVRIKVTRVYDKLSVASTYRTKRVNIGGRNAGLSIHSLFRPPKWETHYETLERDESFERSSEDLDERGSYVLIGDPVVQVLDDDE